MTFSTLESSTSSNTPISVEKKRGDAGALNELVMAWARDTKTHNLRYILELSEKERGLKCECECISCGLPLTAINAAKSVFQRRPHFRHPKGTQSDACLVLAAREAIRHAFSPGELIELPRHRRSAQVVGLSGKTYDAWVEKPAEKVRITSVKFDDGLNAMLVLADGRALQVQLTGTAEASESAPTGIIPKIIVGVDDPAIAGMTPEEIRHRLVPLLHGATWCGHWNDEALESDAIREAKNIADEFLDWGSDDRDLPADLRRESLLHKEVKSILERSQRLRLPGWSITNEDFCASGLPRQISRPESTVHLSSVSLERKLGNIIPDVVANQSDGGILLIEVTVTNQITNERLQRIRQVNLPTLEINLGRMGGRITREQLSKIVTDEIAAKIWLHHPKMEADRQQLANEAEAESRKYAEFENQRSEALKSSVEEWASRYMFAVIQHAELRWQVPISEHDTDTKHHDTAGAREEVERCALKLAIHGYPEAQDEVLYEFGHTFLERLASIKQDKGIGYKDATGWQVINYILQDQSPRSLRWHTLYLIAVKVFPPKLTAAQRGRIDQWRLEVKSSIESGEEKYLRDPKYDRLLGLLFPEMQEALAKPFGKQEKANSWRSRRDRYTQEGIGRVTNQYGKNRINVIPGDDYFAGINEQRWMWIGSGKERAIAAGKNLSNLSKSSLPGQAYVTPVLRALCQENLTSDPWSFSLTLEHQYLIQKSLTLRLLYSIGLIAPMPA